jgi:N-acetylmuramoyl-L-alanine amidase
LIVIDPGHGGTDSGVVRDGVVEKSINLTYAKHLQAALLGRDLACELIREGDDTLSLRTRGALAAKHGAGLVISLHVNSSPEPQHSGCITFARAGDELGASVAKVITGAVPSELRRKRNSFFACDPLEVATNDWARWLSRPLAVLGVFAPTPTVLVEIAHMTNDQDRAEMQRLDVRSGVVAACVAGVDHWRVMTSQGRARGGAPLLG